VEKTFPGGRRLSPVIGIALLLLAGLWLAHPAWLLSSIGVIEESHCAARAAYPRHVLYGA
jgi:hypothetical protein